MITQQILRYKPPVVLQQVKPKFVIGSQEHKEFIFHRAISNESLCELDVGMGVYVNGRPDRGTIIDFIIDFDKVEWHDFKCCFIEVWFNEGDEGLFHPSDFRKKR